MEQITIQDPATGEVIGSLPVSSPEAVKQAFASARAAQGAWAAKPLSERAEFLLSLRETLVHHADAVIDLVRRENGKPAIEALTGEVIPSLEVLTYFAKKAPKLLRDRKIPLQNPLLLHRKSTIQYWPLGVVAVISPWNFPFYLPFAEIAMALLAGNAVVFKPSEVTPFTGRKILELCEEAGLPPGLLQILIGGGEVGAALIEERPAKVFFTGSVETGKKIMAQASKYLIPVNLELGGKDPLIVLPDADLDFATSAALWGGFTNAGQICASTERLLLHERIATPFLNLLQEKIGKLRVGPSTGIGTNEIGPVTYDRQKGVLREQLESARASGAEFVSGGAFSEDGRFLPPTVIKGATPDSIESTSAYREESFGNIMTATTFRTPAEAVAKANASRYGLVASIITKNMTLADRMAREIETGSVLINEVTYTAGLPETPWGGLKDSGFGKKHSDEGLLEFVHARHVHRPRAAFMTTKSMWWFPYTPSQYDLFKTMLRFYKRSPFSKIAALPEFLWHFIQTLKKDPRL